MLVCHGLPVFRPPQALPQLSLKTRDGSNTVAATLGFPTYQNMPRFARARAARHAGARWSRRALWQDQHEVASVWPQLAAFVAALTIAGSRTRFHERRLGGFGQPCCLTLDRCIPAYRPVVMVVEHSGVRAEAGKMAVERCLAGRSRRECGIPQWLLCEERCRGGARAPRNRE